MRDLERVESVARAQPGVSGYSTSGYGLRAESKNGRGAVLIGKKAQLRLSPSSATTHPTTGAKGDLFVDSAGRLWFCKGTTTWVRIA